MDKWKALKEFAGIATKPKHVYKMICAEICDMLKAWKKDKFAPSVSELENLTDEEFKAKYKAEFHGTVQHEAAEAILYIVQFMECHGVDIYEYVEALKRKRNLYYEKKEITVNVYVPVK